MLRTPINTGLPCLKRRPTIHFRFNSAIQLCPQSSAELLARFAMDLGDEVDFTP
jgi:hypothetical protein